MADLARVRPTRMVDRDLEAWRALLADCTQPAEQAECLAAIDALLDERLMAEKEPPRRELL